MPVRIYTTNAGTDLSDAEAALLADLVARHGCAVLLAPTFAELDLCRHDAAEAGASLGIDYKTPTSWLRSLWEFMGDGRSFVDNLQRQMLFSDMIDRRDDAALQPLSRSQGTVRMLARMARDVLPGVAGTGDERRRDAAARPEPKSDAEARVFELLSAYASGLDRRDMVEPCEAADLMAEVLTDNLPACTRTVCVRGSRRLRIACSSCCRPWRAAGERLSCCSLASRRRCARTWLPPLMPAVCCLRPPRWGRTPARPRPLLRLLLSLFL